MSSPRAWARELALASGLTFAAGSAASCAAPTDGFDGPWVQSDAFTLRTPQLYVPPANALGPELAPRAHPLNESVGWAYLTSKESATQINTWTRRPLERLEPLIDMARTVSAMELESGERAWGPFDDPEDAALRWLVVEAGNDEVHLRVRGLDADPASVSWQTFIAVSVTSTGAAVELGRGERQSMRLDAGLVTQLPELGRHLHDTLRTYEGAFVVEAWTSTAGEEHVTVQWQEFAAVDQGLGDASFRVLSDLFYIRAPDGAGRLTFDRLGAYEDLGFTGPELDRMQLSLRWDASQAGAAEILLPEEDPLFPGGDPVAGDLHIEECFDTQGGLSWRQVSPSYLELQPDYLFGEPEDCSVPSRAMAARD